MCSAEPASIGDDVVDYYYAHISDKAELSKRTSTRNILKGQAAFFNLVTRLGVPVLDSSSNHSGGQDHLFVGVGASYHVTRALFALSDRHSRTINNDIGGYAKLAATLKKKRYVTKRIIPDTSSTRSDGQQLGAIANEVRVLANSTLKESKNLVKLLCVAWDEVPTYGRHWPRLLLEAADYGSLGDFLSNFPDATLWEVKIEIILDVMSGLKVLHNHGIVHCDLKLENVLIFRATDKDQRRGKFMYEAKVCDFGFSVIMTDYKQDALFSEHLGTEPWTSPELSFATEIKIQDLPQSDIYSLGLLSSRVFMNGGNPFGNLDISEIRALKRHEEGNSLLLHNTLTNAIFSQVAYSEGQSALIKKHLLVTLGYLPEHRFPLHLLGAEMILLGYAFRDRDNPLDEKTSQNEEAIGLDFSTREKGAGADIVASTPGRVKRTVQKVFGVFASMIVAPFGSIRQRLKRSIGWLLRFIGKKLGMFRDPWEDFLRPKEVYCEPIVRLTSSPLAGEDTDSEIVERESLMDLTNFEDTSKFSSIALSTSVANEIVQNLLQIANESEISGRIRQAEAAYQLSIAYFEGISFPRDPEKGLWMLEKAALKGSKKALTNSPNIFASMDQKMSQELSNACDSAVPKLAKHELHTSFLLVFSGRLAQYDNFTAVRRWIEIAPRELDEYLKSSEYSLIRVPILWSCIIQNRPEQVGDRFDFGILEGYKPFAYENFVTFNKRIFIESVRQHKCLEMTDCFLMTLLQRAAARGDLELIKILVLDLGAEVDACGVVPGLTPLWISCLSGYIDIALFLTQQGAKSTCREHVSGRTILHLLNQFRTHTSIVQILAIGLSAGLSLEDQDSHGNTPLMSTFIGWDFSRGTATKILLELGANGLAQSHGHWTPLCAAVKCLDWQTAQAIADNYLSSYMSRPETQAMSLEDGKSTAFMTLCSQIQFYRQRIGGADLPQKLRRIVEILLDTGSVNAFQTSDLGRNTNPLIAASYGGHDDLVFAILNSTTCPKINEVDKMNGMSALHWSVERGRFASTMDLLLQGANPLLQDKEGLNIFHRAARFAPKLLLQILEDIESTKIPKPGGHSARSLVSMTTSDGFTPFAIAVTEGSTEHLAVAETLRQRYQIDHDSYSLKKSRTETMKTLTAEMVECSVSSNIFTLQQIEYLLNINPAPKFKADTSGDTLLHYAVSGWQYDDINSNRVGYAVLRLLLRTFPGREHLDVTNDRGYTPIHIAVYHSNVIALGIIKDHLASRGQDLDPNFAGPGAPTALHGLGYIRKNLLLKEDDEPHLYTILNKNTASTYKFMRNLGACLMSEREGTMICIMCRVQDELSKGRLLRFLEASRRAFDIKWEFIDAAVPLSAVDTEEASFAVELCWAFDHFVLRARPMLTEDVNFYVEQRVSARFRSTKEEKDFPWNKIEYEESILGYSVQWRRFGRSWTAEERQRLAVDIESAWLAMFPGGDSTRVVVPTRTT